MIKRISANRIYTATNDTWLKNAIIEIDEKNRISQIISNADNREMASAEFYNGIIVPAFVNAHSHLELAHLRNKIEQITGLGGFIARLNDIRNDFSILEKQQAQSRATKEMLQNGIIAIGDICNDTDAFNIKSQFSDRLYFHHFIETWAFKTEELCDKMQRASHLQEFFGTLSAASVTAHAPYSVCPALLQAISQKAQAENAILSIHHQESPVEDLLISKRKGSLFEVLSQRDNDLNQISHEESSAAVIKKYIWPETKLLLVHNTFSPEKDIKMLSKQLPNLYWTLCPNANLFIENALPDIKAIRKYSSQICLGTDSLASNHELSILAEIKTLQNNFEPLEFTELLKWATINGAKALDINKNYGSIEKGKKAALNLLYPFDFKNNKISKNTKVKRVN